MPVSSPPPVAEFVVRMDDAYFRAAAAHLVPVQHSGKSKTFASAALVVLALLGYAIRSVFDRNWRDLALLGVLIALVLVAVFLVRKRLRDARRKTPDYGKDVRVRIVSDGVEMIGSVGTSTWGWSAFRRALLLPDGILFSLTDGAGLWVPSASVVAGSRAAVDVPVASRIADVDGAEVARDESPRVREAAVLAAYRARFDRAYYRGAMFALRPRRARVGHAFAIACFAGAILLGLLFCGIAAADGEWGKVCIGGIPLAGMLVYLNQRPPPDLALVRSPVPYREEMELLVRGAGIELRGARSSIHLQWAALRLARTDPSGILLLDDEGRAVWLPDSALASGSREDVERVVERVVGGRLTSVRPSP